MSVQTYIWLCPSVECRFSSGSNSSATQEEREKVRHDENSCLLSVKHKLTCEPTRSLTSRCPCGSFGCLQDSRNVCGSGTFICGEDLWAGIQLSGGPTTTTGLKASENKVNTCMRITCTFSVLHLPPLENTADSHLMIHSNYSSAGCHNIVNDAHMVSVVFSHCDHLAALFPWTSVWLWFPPFSHTKNNLKSSNNAFLYHLCIQSWHILLLSTDWHNTVKTCERATVIKNKEYIGDPLKNITSSVGSYMYVYGAEWHKQRNEELTEKCTFISSVSPFSYHGTDSASGDAGAINFIPRMVLLGGLEETLLIILSLSIAVHAHGVQTQPDSTATKTQKGINHLSTASTNQSKCLSKTLSDHCLFLSSFSVLFFISYLGPPISVHNSILCWQQFLKSCSTKPPETIK